MTIQRRILLGNLAVAILLLAPAIYAVIRLDQVGERTRRSLESGLNTVREIDRLRADFEEAAQLARLSGAFENDPEVLAKFEATRLSARKTLDRLSPATAQGPNHSEFPHLMALLEGEIALGAGADPPAVAGAETSIPPGPGAAGPSASRSSASAVPGSAPPPGGNSAGGHAGAAGVHETGPAPGSAAARLGPVAPDGGDAPVSSAGPARLVWPEDRVHMAREEISLADQQTRRKLLEETAAIQREADLTGRIGVIALFVTVPLALLSAFFVVRGIHNSLGRLITATSAVAAGQFGIELPVRGDDEITRLARAFNMMSVSLAALDRMKADFVNVVAHELKTPLTVIKGYAGSLRSVLHPRPEDREISVSLERIDHETDLLSRRVAELLTYGVIEAGQLQLEPRDVLTEGFLLMVAEAFRPIAADRGIDFVVEVEPGLPGTFHGDPDRLNQVLLNLLDNAFKYTPRGGAVRLYGRRAGELLEVEVRDTGPGIPKEQIGTIFEKYARVRSGSGGGRGGTGLGLAVARGIVVAHGGTIEVQSEPGHGSSFRIRLPISNLAERGREVA